MEGPSVQPFNSGPTCPLNRQTDPGVVKQKLGEEQVQGPCTEKAGGTRSHLTSGSCETVEVVQKVFDIINSFNKFREPPKVQPSPPA